MKPIVTPTDLERAACALIRAERTILGIEVSMPVVYPSGQLVTVVVTVQGADYLVHDSGFGAMALTEGGVRLGAELNQRLTQLAEHYGCDFLDGRMSRKATTDQVALALVMVANASRTVGDQVLHLRRQKESRFRAEVGARLFDLFGQRLRQNETVVGTSGRKYRVPHIILDKSKRHVRAHVVVVSSRDGVATQFAELWDIGKAHPQVANDAIYNQASDLRPEDLALLGKVSHAISSDRVQSELAQLVA